MEVISGKIIVIQQHFSPITLTTLSLPYLLCPLPLSPHLSPGSSVPLSHSLPCPPNLSLSCLSPSPSLVKYMRRTLAAITIQKFQRMCVQRKLYLQKQAAALVMQTILRAYMARQKYQGVRDAYTIYTHTTCFLFYSLCGGTFGEFRIEEPTNTHT